MSEIEYNIVYQSETVPRVLPNLWAFRRYITTVKGLSMSTSKPVAETHTLSEAAELLNMAPNEVVLRMHKIGINMAAMRVKTLTPAQLIKIKRVK